MAAVGSAIGLGNVWRFPYVCYTNGGGAFLIPYFVALFTAGIPLMILEFSLGHMTREPPPRAFGKTNPKMRWLGWFTTLVPFAIATYYAVIMAWCFSYMVYSFDLRWGDQAGHFFNSIFLHLSPSPELIGGIQLPILLALIAIWVTIFLILYKGVHRIGKVVSLTVPLPTILLIILTIRGLTLPGAIDGINYYLTPNFQALGDINVWLAAYAQIFFSLSLAQGIMITYASFLKKDSDINNNAVIAALADAGTSFFAGFTVFSVIGYLAATSGIGIEQLGIAGPTLIFVTYPTAIGLLPVAAGLFGVLFYIALLTFGIDSAFSMIEPLTSSLEAERHINKTKATAIICGIGFLISIIFTTQSGLYWLEILDHHIANFALVSIGLLECIALAWFVPVPTLRKHANKTSDITIGRWWDLLIKYINPAILFGILILSVIDSIQNPYGGYSWSILLIGGIIPITLLLAISIILSRRSNGGETHPQS